MIFTHPMSVHLNIFLFRSLFDESCKQKERRRREKNLQTDDPLKCEHKSKKKKKRDRSMRLAHVIRLLNSIKVLLL